MRKKILVILILAALLVATGAILAKPGEDSDCARITKYALGWGNPLGKEGGDEGIFLGIKRGEDSD